MKKKLFSIIISGLLSLGIVACSNTQSSEEDNTTKQEQELKEEDQDEKEEDNTIKQEPELKEKNQDEKDAKVKEVIKKDEWHCPICGSTTCTPNSECDSLVECLSCGELGVLGKDIEYWVNSEGSTIFTHSGICTQGLQEEDRVHAMRNYICPTCGITVESNEVEWKGECDDCYFGYNESGYSNECPGCGGELEPNGKDADCGWGY